jgi:small subunit ribosomal protein S11
VHNTTKLGVQAIVHISNTLTNTILTLTDSKGNVKIRTTAGACGFKGSRRSTRHAAQVAGIAFAKKGVKTGISRVLVKIKGLGYGKQSSIKGLYKGGMRILRIEDVTTLPFNGCRAPKRAR